MDLEQQSRQDLYRPEKARTFFGDAYPILPLNALLPAEIPIKQMHSVLDIGCGAGEWACHLAQKYPWLRIIGLDTSDSLIEQATQRARAEKISAISFQQFDPDRLLKLPGESYDLVHVHSFTCLLITSMRDQLLEQMQRLLTPDGWLNIVDYEQGTTSSPALNELSRISLKGLCTLCGGFIPSSSNYSAGVHLYGFLVDSGLVDVSYTIQAVDYGVNSHPLAPAFLNGLITNIVHMKPLLLLLSLTTSENFDALLRQAQQELYSPYACGYAYFISAIGRKDI